MKIELTRENFKAALAALKKARPARVALRAGAGLPGSAEGLAALKAAADLCIERGVPLEIAGIAPCLAPGYARYLKTSPGKSSPCPAAKKCFLAGGCSGIPARHAAQAAAFKPPERGFTDLERCMLAILSAKNGLSTAQVLKAARGLKICSSCSNEGEVFRAAERLIKFGLVAKKYSGGEYLWIKN
ncbi:MAG TPA: hypothetical protein DEQ38_14170 [Elusimicrobia bacterium]|nr:MAG: hypothetical protein A2089_07120 [Elusimicrobia bacterium GWD2_63_28]HCC49243.1 hypothetical protein [Elusimicrobiota bacterium]